MQQTLPLLEGVRGNLQTRHAAAIFIAVALVLVLGLSSSGSSQPRVGSQQHVMVRLSAACSQEGKTAGAAAAAGQAGAACKVSTEYISSELEQLWLKNAAAWQDNFCSHMAQSDESTKAWLQGMASMTVLQAAHKTGDKSPAQMLAEQKQLDPRVFSRFKTTYDCGSGQKTEQVTWIEPLSHGLRHPNALCNRGTDVMDRTYLLLAHQSEHAAANKLGNVQCKGRTCQNIYFDLGATTLKPNADEAGQGWFYTRYKAQGISFDRYLLWEAVTQTPANIYANVPKADMHKYQYFNIPVTPDASDPSNPVRMLKEIAQPGDFVVFKLDIDNFGVEHAILDALRADPEAMALLDEFFFEEHVAFREMSGYWGGTVGPGTSLASSYATFHSLRSKGLRAHSWV